MWRAQARCGCYLVVRSAEDRARDGGGDEVRQVIIFRGEDGYWVVECPSLPGCVSQGQTKEEAIANIKEAIRGYVAVLEEDRLPVPEERFEALVLAV